MYRKKNQTNAPVAGRTPMNGRTPLLISIDNEQERKVFTLLYTHPLSLSSREVSHRLEMPLGNAQNALLALFRRGYIDRIQVTRRANKGKSPKDTTDMVVTFIYSRKH